MDAPSSIRFRSSLPAGAGLHRSSDSALRGRTPLQDDFVIRTVHPSEGPLSDFVPTRLRPISFCPVEKSALPRHQPTDGRHLSRRGLSLDDDPPQSVGYTEAACSQSGGSARPSLDTSVQTPSRRVTRVTPRPFAAHNSAYGKDDRSPPSAYSPSAHACANPKFLDVLRCWLDLLWAVIARRWLSLFALSMMWRLRHCASWLALPVVITAAATSGGTVLWWRYKRPGAKADFGAAVTAAANSGSITDGADPVFRRTRNNPEFSIPTSLARLSIASAPPQLLSTTSTASVFPAPPVGTFASAAAFEESDSRPSDPIGAVPEPGTMGAEGNTRAVLRRLLEEISKSAEIDAILTQQLGQLGLRYSSQHPVLAACLSPFVPDSLTNAQLTVNLHDRNHAALMHRASSLPSSQLQMVQQLLALLQKRRRIESLVLFPEPVERDAISRRVTLWLQPPGFDQTYRTFSPLTDSTSGLTDADLLYRILYGFARLKMPTLKTDAQGTLLQLPLGGSLAGGGGSQIIGGEQPQMTSLQLLGGLPCSKAGGLRVQTRKENGKKCDTLLLPLADCRRNALIVGFAIFYEACNSAGGASFFDLNCDI